jgi:uncharacterized protein YjbJ (UPF0337 family)
MGMWDKLRNKAQRLRGRGEQRLGRATGDRHLARKGRGNRLRSGAKQVGEQGKDTAKETRKTFRR